MHERGLVRGEGFATDASFIRADANRTRGVPGDQVPQWGWTVGELIRVFLCID